VPSPSSDRGEGPTGTPSTPPRRPGCPPNKLPHPPPPVEAEAGPLDFAIHGSALGAGRRADGAAPPSRGAGATRDPLSLFDSGAVPRPRGAWLPGGGRDGPGAAQAHVPEPPPARASRRRPLTAPTFRRGESQEAGSSGRTVPQLEDALRRWLARHRRLHEDRRVTLVRALTSAVRCPKDTQGIPLGVLETALSRQSLARSGGPLLAADPLGGGPGGDAGGGASAQVGRPWGVLAAAPNLRASLESDGARPLTAVTADEDLARIDQDPSLTEPERWGYRRQVQVAAARALRGSAGRVPNAESSYNPRVAYHPDAGVGGEAPHLPGGAWSAPPPRRLAQPVRLREERGEAEARSKSAQGAGRTKMVLSGVVLTQGQLEASWARMLREEEEAGAAPAAALGPDGGVMREVDPNHRPRPSSAGAGSPRKAAPPAGALYAPLTGPEAARLMEKYGRPRGAHEVPLGGDEGDGDGDGDGGRAASWAQVRSVPLTSGTLRGRVLDLGRLVDEIAQPANAELHEKPVEKGAPSGSAGALGSKYYSRHARTGAHAPSDADARAVFGASASPPGATLELEHVYGYAGVRNTGQNLFYTRSGKVVYYTAGLGIVAEPTADPRTVDPADPDGDGKKAEGEVAEGPPSMAFFRRHTDDVTSIALHPDGDTVATGQCGEEPSVYVWSSETLREKMWLRLPSGHRSVTALGFSRKKGRYLAAVSTDNDHTVTVWDWRRNQVATRGHGYKGTPPQVLGLEWDPHLDTGEERFVTFGAAHLKVWRQVLERGRLKWEPKGCSWNGAEPTTVLSAQFLPPGLDGNVRDLVASAGTPQGKVGRGAAGRDGGRSLDLDVGMIATGHPMGEVLFWRNYAAVSRLQVDGVPRGVSARAAGEVESFHGVRGLRCFRLEARPEPAPPTPEPSGREEPPSAAPAPPTPEPSGREEPPSAAPAPPSPAGGGGPGPEEPAGRQAALDREVDAAFAEDEGLGPGEPASREAALESSVDAAFAPDPPGSPAGAAPGAEGGEGRLPSYLSRQAGGEVAVDARSAPLHGLTKPWELSAVDVSHPDASPAASAARLPSEPSSAARGSSLSSGDDKSLSSDLDRELMRTSTMRGLFGDAGGSGEDSASPLGPGAEWGPGIAGAGSPAGGSSGAEAEEVLGELLDVEEADAVLGDVLAGVPSSGSEGRDAGSPGTSEEVGGVLDETVDSVVTGLGDPVALGFAEPPARRAGPAATGDPGSRAASSTHGSEAESLGGLGGDGGGEVSGRLESSFSGDIADSLSSSPGGPDGGAPATRDLGAIAAMPPPAAAGPGETARAEAERAATRIQAVARGNRDRELAAQLRRRAAEDAAAEAPDRDEQAGGPAAEPAAAGGPEGVGGARAEASTEQHGPSTRPAPQPGPGPGPGPPMGATAPAADIPAASPASAPPRAESSQDMSEDEALRLRGGVGSGSGYSPASGDPDTSPEAAPVASAGGPPRGESRVARWVRDALGGAPAGVEGPKGLLALLGSDTGSEEGGSGAGTPSDSSRSSVPSAWLQERAQRRQRGEGGGPGVRASADSAAPSPRPGTAPGRDLAGSFDASGPSGPATPAGRPPAPALSDIDVSAIPSGTGLDLSVSGTDHDDSGAVLRLRGGAPGASRVPAGPVHVPTGLGAGGSVAAGRYGPAGGAAGGVLGAAAAGLGLPGAPARGAPRAPPGERPASDLPLSELAARGDGRDLGLARRLLAEKREREQRPPPGPAGAGGAPRRAWTAGDAAGDGAEPRWVLATGGGDGVVRLWDLGHEAGPPRTAEPVALEVPRWPNDEPQAVRALDLDVSRGCVVVGTRDCDVWEAPLPDWMFAGGAGAGGGAPGDGELGAMVRLVNGNVGDLSAVAWHPRARAVFATCCDSREVFLYNAAKRHSIGMPVVCAAAAVSVAFSRPDGRLLAVGCADGTCHVFDQRRREVWRQGLSARPLSAMAFSEDGRVLAVGSRDGAVHLVRADPRPGGGWAFAPYATCRGHSAAVLQLDFSEDGLVLQTNSNDYEALTWDVASGRQLVQNQRDRRWATWTCRIGFPVLGIWPEGADGSDVNAVHRDPQAELLVTADDRGKVRLYNWPCAVADAACDAYAGHSAHVTGVRFSRDGSRVVSVGGRDRAALQWRVVRSGGAPRAGPLGPAPAGVRSEPGSAGLALAVKRAAEAEAREAETRPALADVLIERALAGPGGSNQYARRRLRVSGAPPSPRSPPPHAPPPRHGPPRVPRPRPRPPSTPPPRRS